jgi:hypothetical protein
MAKLPTVVSNVAPDLRAFINRVREALDSGGTSRLLTVDDLISSGIASPGPGGTIIPPGGGTITTPPTPKNVAASGAIQNIVVTWDDPLYYGHAYAEVWGSSTDNLGAAVQVGMTPGAIFIDAVGPSVNRYYWVRFVNTLGTAGAFNAVAGVLGQTGSDVAYLLDTLAGQITESELYNDLNGRIDEIDGGPGGTTGLLSKYTVKVDLAGHVAGYGIAATANNGTPTSSFGVRADQFWIAPPSTVSATAPTTNLYAGYVWIDSSVTPNITKYYNGTGWQTTQVKGAIPFVVQTSPTTVNGVAVPAGVYIDAAYIKNGTITTAKIGNAQIDDAKIASLSAGKITAGSISVGSYIQSSNYLIGSQGWKIHGNGTAEFAAASIRGLITAAQIDSRGLSIKDASGNIILAAGSPLSTGNISGLGTLATQSSVSTGQVTGLGTLATQNSVNWNTQIVNVPAFGGFAYLSTITSANISTYIASAAIGNAYISSLSATKITAGSIAVGQYIRSANYVSGSAGWEIDGNGDAEFNELTVRSGQVVGALLRAVKVSSYSGLYIQISWGTPISTTNGPYYLYGSGPPQYLVGFYTMPAPETAAHRVAAVINVQSIGGSANKDLAVLLVANASISGTTINGEQVAYNTNSGVFGLATNAAGVTTNTYSTSTVFAVFAGGNNADYTIQTIDGLLFGVR